MTRDERIRWLKDQLRETCAELDLLTFDGRGSPSIERWERLYGKYPGEGYRKALEIQAVQGARELARMGEI